MLREQRFDTFSNFYDTDTSFSKLICECGSCIDIIENNQNSDLFIESENNKSFIKKIVDKIKKVIQNIIDKITQFFNKNKIEKIVKDNPDLKNVEIDIPDYEKISKEADTTMKKIDKAESKEEVSNLVDKFKSNKKKIIAGAGLTLTLSASLLIIKKIKNKNNDKRRELDRIFKEAMNSDDILMQKTLGKLNIISDEMSAELQAADKAMKKIVDEATKKIEKEKTNNDKNKGMRRNLTEEEKKKALEWNKQITKEFRK